MQAYEPRNFLECLYQQSFNSNLVMKKLEKVLQIIQGLNAADFLAILPFTYHSKYFDPNYSGDNL